MAVIEFVDICKYFGDNKVINHLNLTIQNGSFTVLVGPSGCGKTTLLRMIAGIGKQTSGKILLDGEDISNLQPSDRNLAMVFQNYALYPTMTVRGNIEFGLINNKVPKIKREELIQKVSQIVGLSEYLDRKPSTLSGGQRQRVALARAMVKEPKVFLMDEPLSNLDAKLRAAMRTEQLNSSVAETNFIYVTHDQIEAMSMADHIILMNEGKIMQEGSPKSIYNDPDNVFTAQFIGTPPMNLFHLSDQYSFGFRSEKAIISKKKSEGTFNVPGKIITKELLGYEVLYKIRVGKAALMVKSEDDSFDFNSEVYISVKDNSFFFFDKAQNRIRENLTDLIRDAIKYGESLCE